MAPELSPTSSQRLPPSIGRYEILNLLGQGGMAQVFLALQRGAFSSEKLVVIKQLRPELVSDEAFLTMFMDEARIALQLHHPNVVHTYEVGTENGDYFLAMEFLEGLTLSQIIRKAGREGLPLHLHLWILTQVLAGLGYAHELRSLDGEPMGIVHRDVSPSNVMVTSSGEVKLLDFGIAKAAGALSLTQHGVIKGKLGYVAPEQCVGKPSDARADLYAVGVMVWEAIAGRRRASAETSAAAFEARIRNLEPPIEAVVPDVPPRLAEICRRGLAHDPQDRYSSAAEFRADLDDFLDSTYSRVGASKLAAQMVQLFTEEFTALRLRIERYVQANRRPTTSSERVPRLTNSEPVTQLAPEPTLQSKRSRWLLAMAAGGALVAAGAFLARSTPAPVPAPPPAVSTPAAVTSPAPPAPESAAPASSVRVNIVVFPKSAQLLLDGRRIENPFNRELPPDKSSHHLEARAEGYHTSSQEVTFSQDVQMVLDLDRVGAPRSNRGSVGRLPKQAAAASPAPRAEALPPAISTAPARAAVAPARTAEPSAQPGQDLRTAPRAPRALDEKDLYQ